MIFISRIYYFISLLDIMNCIKRAMVVVLLCAYSNIFSQDVIIPGLPFTTNFSFEKYNAYSQNWGITQSKNGIMYFANGEGILEYDGSNWNLIKLPNKALVRSINCSDNGTIYVGGFDEFGYLETSNNGELKYISLINKIDYLNRKIQDIWSIVCIDSTVFFQSYYSVFIYENNEIKEIQTDDYYIMGFNIDAQYYVNEQFKGLMIYENDSLYFIKGSKRFADDIIYGIVPYSDNKNLLITSIGNIFITKFNHNNHSLQIVDSIINTTHNFLKENEFYSGCSYATNQYCFGSIYDGFLLTDSILNPTLHLSKSFGLYDDNIRYIFEDQSKNIWLATDRGISYVNINSSLSVFNEYSNLSGSVNSVVVFDDSMDNIPKRLYVATTEQVYYKNVDFGNEDILNLDNFQKFIGIEDLKMESWNLLSYNNTLLCATSLGIFQIKNNKTYLINDYPAWSFTGIKNHPELMLVNLDEGMNLIELKDGKWEFLFEIKGFDDIVAYSSFDEDENLWVEAIGKGLFRLKFSENFDSVIETKLYDVSNGLPSKNLNYPFEYNNDIAIATEKGVYIYDKKKDLFIPHDQINEILKNDPIDFLHKDSSDNLWFSSRETYSFGRLINDKGVYTLDTIFANEIKNISIWDIYYYNDSNVFFCSPNGLILYKKYNKIFAETKFNTIIKKIEILNNPDSIIIIDGYCVNDDNSDKKPQHLLKYKQNALKFTYTTPCYASINKKYSYKLEGFTNDWSPWTTQTEKEFNYLKEGDYTFYVKSRSALMIEGSVSSFSFKILPPFYRTWIAYTLYIIFAAFLIYVIINYYTQRLKFANIKLEKKIEARTNEIRKQNQELHEHKEYILKQRNDLHVLNANKDKFFSIVAHDLKNPFNTILGFSELLMDNLGDDKSEDNYTYSEIINKSANSTLELLENLLTWSNIQGNSIKCKPQKLLISKVVNDCLLNLNQLAEIKNISLQYKLRDVSLLVYADPNMISTIFRNLITNAIKFSHSGSKVIIKVNDSGNNVVISIKDEGVGITKKNIERLFKVEENVSTEGTEKEKGSGLGLVLCHEFIKINKGSIWVKSIETKGSTFFISLPKNKVS